MDNKYCEDGSVFKEAVCVDSSRIYDSCSDKDCLRDLRVLFPEAIQRSVIDTATSVKVKNVAVLDVLIDVEALPFNRGFYAVNMTYYFEVTAEVLARDSAPCTVVGVATAEKKAILFGSDGNVRVFRSDLRCGEVNEQSNLPTAKVQVVDPICLDCSLEATCSSATPVCVPDCICEYFKCCYFGRRPGSCDDTCTGQDLFITLGLFSIVLLERRVSMLVPCFDFCIPDKDCSASSKSEQTPCELFEQIRFPTDQFFPPRLDPDCDTGCGC